jgi:hypothetical protein
MWAFPSDDDTHPGRPAGQVQESGQLGDLPTIVDLTVGVQGWYLRYGMSYCDVEKLLARRGVEVDHVTVYRWVQRFHPWPCCSPSN